jgi:hypothetical protein
MEQLVFPSNHRINYAAIILLFLLLELTIGVAFIFSKGLFVLATLLAVMMICIIIKDPRIGLILLFGATSLDAFGNLQNFVGIPVTVFHIILLLTVFSWIIHRLRKSDLSLPYLPIVFPMTIFFTILVFSLLYSPAVFDGFYSIIRLLLLFSIVLMVVDHIKEKKWLDFLLFSLIGSILVVSLFAIAELFTQQHLVLNIFTKGIFRSRATFADPNQLAISISVAILLTMTMMQNVKTQRLKLILWLILFILGFALLTTFSRSAWLATFCGVFVIAAFKKFIRKIIIIIALVSFVIISIAGFSVFGKLIIYRFQSIMSLSGSDVSIMTRWWMSLSGLKMFLHSPIFERISSDIP